MAQLKDSVIQGNIRATGTVIGTGAQFQTIEAPSADSVTFSAGNDGDVLTSNGSNVYWGTRDVDSSQVHRNAALNGTNDIAVQPLVDIARANRLMFLPASQIIIEQTTDGGQTWTNAHVSDAVKRTLFWEQSTMIPLPTISSKQNTLCGLRVTITAMKYNVPSGTEEVDKYNYWNSSYVTNVERYSTLFGMYFYVNTNSNENGISIKIERATGAASTTWEVAAEPDPTKFTLTGWSGSNFITFPEETFGGRTTQTDRYWNYRMTFMTCARVGHTFDSNRAAAQQIGFINGYGNDCWISGNNLMQVDHIYKWDADQNTTFPNKVTAASFSGNGSGLTNLNGSNIASGTIPVARLPIEDIRTALGL